MRHIGDIVLHHDLPTAGAIEIADLADANPGSHEQLPLDQVMKPAPPSQSNGCRRDENGAPPIVLLGHSRETGKPGAPDRGLLDHPLFAGDDTEKKSAL
jgi:hypothetical protein